MSYRPPTRPLPTRRAVISRTLAGMSAYRYRCEQCTTTSPTVRTRAAVEYERDRHRRIMHGGHIPDGDRLQRTARAAADRTAVVALCALAVVLLVALLAG